MIGHDVHLLVHPDVVVDVGLLVDSAGRHREQAEGDHHLLLDAGLLGFPVGDAVDERLQRVLRLLLAGDFEEVAFEGDAIVAVDQACGRTSGR